MLKSSVDWSLYLVTDQKLCGSRSIERVVMESVAGGVSAVQLRAKDLSTREFTKVAASLRLALPAHVPLIVNDRVDVAMASGADGVHIGQSDMEYTDARRLMGNEAIIGISIESTGSLCDLKNGADYFGISPVFATTTKLDTEASWGLAGLRGLRSRTPRPLIGIGGIHPENVGELIPAGADGAAVVSAICASPDPRRAASQLRGEIERARLKLRQSYAASGLRSHSTHFTFATGSFDAKE